MEDGLVAFYPAGGNDSLQREKGYDREGTEAEGLVEEEGEGVFCVCVEDSVLSLPSSLLSQWKALYFYEVGTSSTDLESLETLPLWFLLSVTVGVSPMHFRS